MKTKLILILGMMVSTSSMAAEICGYFAKEVGNTHNDLSQKAIKVVERKMEKKGFKRVFAERDAAYTLQFSADSWWGAWNGLENENRGDSEATVKLISNSDQSVKVEGARKGAAGYLLGIGKRAKAASLLSRTMAIVPDCSEL